MLGTSQVLSSLHVDHTFISEVDLTPENLKRFKVLILGNAPYLSDAQIKVIKEFASDGGVVAASYMTGIADELGKIRKRDMIAEIFNFPANGKLPSTGKAFAVSVTDGEEQPFEKELLYRQLPNMVLQKDTPKLYNRNRAARPAVLETTFGKGRCSILIIYNGNNHYFKLTSIVPSGALIELNINETLELRINNNTIQSEETPSSSNIINLTTKLVSSTDGNDLLLYNDAGFFHGFLKNSSGTVIPVLIIDNLDIDFSQYSTICYSFRTDNESHEVTLKTDASSYTFVYPRIMVYDSNVNYKSDRIKLIPYETNFTIET
jgi:hypothetical protein